MSGRRRTVIARPFPLRRACGRGPLRTVTLERRVGREIPQCLHHLLTTPDPSIDFSASGQEINSLCVHSVRSLGDRTLAHGGRCLKSDGGHSGFLGFFRGGGGGVFSDRERTHV